MATQQITAPALTPDEERAKALSRMRALATWLLVLAALIFLATHLFTDQSGVWGFVARGAEAAMIGAIADWFAVTALFRHPLGIPIPHTAIIPRRKDTLGKSLSSFVADNFLSGAVVTDKVHRAEPLKRAGNWLAEPGNQEKVVERAASGINYVLDRVDDRAVKSVFDDLLVPKVVAMDKAPVLGHLLGDIVRDGSHHGVVDLISKEAYDWLIRNPEVMDRIVLSRSPTWVPSWVNEQVSAKLRKELLGWAEDFKNDKYHHARQAIDAWLLRLAQDLQDDTPPRDKLEQIINELLERPGTSESAMEIWGTLKRSFTSSINEPDGEVRKRIHGAVDGLAQRLLTDDEWRAKLEGQLAQVVGDLAESFGPEIASVISDTIERWDAREASDRIELFVGRDLQYIRINGTVIGALVGVLIHAVTLLIG